MSGDGDMVRKGGQLKFSGGNEATKIEEGTLSLGSSSDLFDGTAVTVDSGAIFDVSLVIFRSISGFGNIQILTGEQLSVDVAAGANLYFLVNSVVRGLVKQGEGSQVLSGNSSGYGPFPPSLLKREN